MNQPVDPELAEFQRLAVEAQSVEEIKPPKKYARSQAELRALEQRNDAFKQRRIQIFLVTTNVIISALIALKTFDII